MFLGDVGSYSLGAALAVLAADAVLRGVPVEAVLGPLALYLADTAWTLQRRIRAGERWLQAHRTHVYQQWCDAGWSHQEVTLLTGALTILLTLLGTVSLSRDLPARAAADLIGLAVLAAYLCSPALFRRLGLYGNRNRTGLAARRSLAAITPRARRVQLTCAFSSSRTISRRRPGLRRPGSPRWPGPGPQTATR